MADVVTIVQVISAATSRATQCAQVIRGLHDLAGNFKDAEISTRSTAHELQIIQLAWQRIERVLENWANIEASDHDLLFRLGQSLEFGRLIVLSLAQDIELFSSTPLSFSQRSKYIWNEERFKDHKDRIRGQVSAMNLLVSVIRL